MMCVNIIGAGLSQVLVTCTLKYIPHEPAKPSLFINYGSTCWELTMLDRMQEIWEQYSTTEHENLPCMTDLGKL